MKTKTEDHALAGKKIAILVDNGFEEDELTSPKKAVEEAGAETANRKFIEEVAEGKHKLCMA